MKKTYVALGAILTVMAPATLTAQEVTLRLSHWVPPTISPATKGINPWAESVMAEVIYPDGTRLILKERVGLSFLQNLLLKP